MKQYEKALSLNPNLALCHYRLGEVLAQQGELDTAVKYLEKAIELKPDVDEFKNSSEQLLINKRNAEKIFCISFQRTGTTSVGQFFRDFGYRTIGWPEDSKYEFSKAWHEGNNEYIFSHPIFLSGQVFEDSPWFFPSFYKVLFHRFPNSKFILMTRNPDDWFKSMQNHNMIPNLVNTQRHCKIYRREQEWYELIDSGDLKQGKKLTLEDNPKHYKDVYKLHAREAIDFFQTFAPDALFSCQLEDPDKWKKLGDFCGINVPDSYDVHVNKTQKTST